MANHNEMGKEGETLARRYLEEQGYEILELNWRLGHHEADIIAYKDGRIVFVEVKTRKTDEYGDPESFVDVRKQRSYILLADAYVKKHDRNEDVRFDIVSVIINKEGTKIEHLENAFTTIG